MDFQKGELLLINKPYRWTSFDVVNKIRIILTKFCNATQQSTIKIQQLKVGHAGTLDPLATGLLIVCTGKLTKEIDNYQSKEKEYGGTFFIGATTSSYDLETNIDHQFEIAHINDESVIEAAKKFTGKLMQVPPVHSAVKVEGQRAYKRARQGLEIAVQPKEIFISEFEITKIELPLIHFRIVCSKGTYIRSVAHDFGKALKSGAYLSSLCRTRIGDFKLENALTIEQFIEKFQTVYS